MNKQKYTNPEFEVDVFPKDDLVFTLSSDGVDSNGSGGGFEETTNSAQPNSILGG